MDALPPAVTNNLGSVGNRVLVNHSRFSVSSIRKSTSPIASLNSNDCSILEILVWNLGFTSHFSFSGLLVTFDDGVVGRSVELWVVGRSGAGGESGLVAQPEEVLYNLTLRDGGSF